MSYGHVTLQRVEENHWKPCVVLFNGTEVQDDVCELDDVEGWILRYVRDRAGHIRLNETRTAPMAQRYYGRVEFIPNTHIAWQPVRERVIRIREAE